MQIKAKTLKTLLTIGALLVLFTAMMPGALSDGGYGKDYSECKDSYCKMGSSKAHYDIKSVDMVKTVTGVRDNTVFFQVPSVAITTKEGKVSTVTFPTPLTGAFNLRQGMGFLSMGGARSADVAIRPLSTATLNISGSSMVMSMKDIKVITDDKDKFAFEYHKIGLVLPDGTAKVYCLDKPVQVAYSKDRKAAMIDAYPAYGDILAYAYTNMNRFSDTQQPLSIKELRTAETTGRVQSIGTAPVLRAPPTPIPTASPTTTPIATPIVTPTPEVSPTPIVTPIVTPVVSPTPIPTEVPTATPIIEPEPTESPIVTPIVTPTPVPTPISEFYSR
ncbi:hypothetical protein [Methanocella sp. MCL-LM]|uniref:hypothetical protein n=1 Tax=Methanocella sp. MCL-LM TaxID=3412035 RepID=UPI003C70F375